MNTVETRETINPPCVFGMDEMAQLQVLIKVRNQNRLIVKNMPDYHS